MPVAKFSLATNERFKDKEGEWQDRTEWHNMSFLQRLAEIVGEYLKKGGKCLSSKALAHQFVGRQETSQKKYKTEIIANDLVLLSGRGEGAEAIPEDRLAEPLPGETISISAGPKRNRLHPRPSATKIFRSIDFYLARHQAL